MAKKSASKKIVPGTDETIAIPAISKSTAGAATGAVVGAVGGPIGAVVGGVVGAVLGKRAESGKPVMRDVKRTARQVVSRCAGSGPDRPLHRPRGKKDQALWQ